MRQRRRCRRGGDASRFGRDLWRSCIAPHGLLAQQPRTLAERCIDALDIVSKISDLNEDSFLLPPLFRDQSFVFFQLFLKLQFLGLDLLLKLSGWIVREVGLCYSARFPLLASGSPVCAVRRRLLRKILRAARAWRR